jgi:hypothetical protein
LIKPERRTRADVLAAAAIAVVVVVAAALIWWTSDARATISRPAAAPVPSIAPAKAVPASLDELWHAASAKTTGPVVVGGAVVTGDGPQVVGHDPKSGASLWSFARDRDLCGVTWIYHWSVAVYPDDRGCGQVSTVDGATGRRGPTRTGYADKRVTLSSDGSTVLEAGDTRLEMWRSDMVRTLAYGQLDAPVNPPAQPQPPCKFLSSAASSSAASVLESCPKMPDVRLTMLRVAKDDTSPDLRYAMQTGVGPGAGASVLVVSDLRTAIYLPSPPRVVVVDETGAQVSSTLLSKAPQSPIPAGAVSRAGNMITFWTGDSVLVLDAANLAYRYTVAATGPAVPLGPAGMMADRLLIPVTGGVGVYDPATGRNERVIPVDRAAAAGPIVLGIAGTTVLEQRGGTIVALGQRA